MASTIMHDQTKHSRSSKLAVVSSSVHTYLNYRKKMQERLAELNDNVSSVIKESCSGIDTICNKVRQCLSEMDGKGKKSYLTDEITEYEILEEQSKSQEENSQDTEDMDDVTLIEDVEEKFDTEENAEISSPLTPFYTVIKPENSAQPHDKEIYQKQILNKTIYSLMSQNLSMKPNEESFDDFKEKMETLCNSFEEMNRLVDDINKEISKFSETAISEEKQSQCNMEDYVESNQPSGLKPIKRLSKKNSRQKCIQVGDCLSKTETELIELDEQFSGIIPDVYRKRAFTDLYQKLVAQVEANDSLIFFQTVMKRQKKHESNRKKIVSQMKLNIPVMNYSVPKKCVSNSSSRIKPTKPLDLNKKYAGSLWFSQRNVTRSHPKGGPRKTLKDVKNNMVTKTVENRSLNGEHDRQPSEQKKNKQSKRVSDSNRSLPVSKPPPKCDSLENIQKACSLECTCRMVVQNDMPSSPSTKCQLHWLKVKESQAPTRTLEFLDILDDLTHRDLQPLNSEYPRRDNQQPRELDYKDIQDTYLYKLLYGKHGTKTVWRQLIEANVTHPKNCTAHKPAHPPPPRRGREENAGEKFMEKFSTQNYSKTEVLKKLAPYMHDPERLVENYSNTVIVMPVQVFYDNYKLQEPPTKLNSGNKSSLSLLKKFPIPLKDNKWPKRNDKPTPKISKPVKVVYDSLSKKPENPGVSPSTKQISMSPRLPTNSSRSYLENQPRKVTSRSFSPRGFASYCQTNKAFKNVPTEPDKQKNIDVFKKIQKDIQKIKKEVYGKGVGHNERKLWAHKYGKSIGQQLITFVKHQEPQPVKPVPIYATPKLQIQTNVQEKQKTSVGALKGLNPQKQMLQQVQHLRAKNESIQSNIKKAIQVIETRMVDILCDDSNSVEAFDIMEKEITSVLDQMKCKMKTNLKTISSRCESKEKIVPNSGRSEDVLLEENYKVISDNLFARLEKILDTGGSSLSNVLTDKSREVVQKKRKDKDETRKKHKLSNMRRTKTDFLSPSTSASMDEKITVKRSPRSTSKQTEKSKTKPKLTPTQIITTPITITNICGDQNIVKDTPTFNELNDTKNVEEKPPVYNYEEPISQSSGGDFLKYEDAVENNVETNNITLDFVISDDRVEKLISEEKIEAQVVSPEPIEKIETYELETDTEIEKYIKEEVEKAVELVVTSDEDKCNTYKLSDDTETEEFINDEINKVIDSIVILEEETGNKELQEEPTENLEVIEESKNVNGVEKEHFEYSNYNTPSSEGLDTEKKVHELKEESEFQALEEPCKFIEKEEDSSVHLEVEINLLTKENAQETSKIEKIVRETNTACGVEKDIQTDDENDSKNVEQTPKSDTPRLEVEKTIKTVNENDTKNPEKVQKNISPKSKHLEVEKNNKVAKNNQTTYSEQVQKIIKRVEDIYSQLDDIHDSDLDKIPVFSDPDISDVHSEMFLTPFMHAVKETRQNVNNPNKTKIIQKSPSYYNVMTFLDALTNIQKEVAGEVHFARLYRYVYVVHRAIVYYPSVIWYETQHSTSTRPKSGCLKKNNDHPRHVRCKKVSFHQTNKEDKSSQVTLCPFHKVKVVRISSQQFPPSEQKETPEKVYVTKKKCYKINGENEAEKICKRELENELSQKCTVHGNVTTHKTTKKLCELHGSGDQKLLRVKQEESTKNEGGREKINRHESIIGDKSTQVFCQMQKSGENSTNCSVTEENVQVATTKEQSKYIEDNIKFTDKDFLDNSLTSQEVMQKFEFTNEEDTDTNVSEQIQPKIAVFKDSLEEDSFLPPKSINNINDIELYKRRLEKRKELRLMRKTSGEIVRHRVQNDNKNVVLLKSFYAIVYVLMFTALSLDYRCL